MRVGSRVATPDGRFGTAVKCTEAETVLVNFGDAHQEWPEQKLMVLPAVFAVRTYGGMHYVVAVEDSVLHGAERNEVQELCDNLNLIAREHLQGGG